jgi:hypothetical protein
MLRDVRADGPVSGRRTATWMVAAAAVALLLTLLVLARVGSGERGVHLALRITARWSFLLFWLAYAGAALATLFGPSFRGLARRGRELGLAFASAHLVHIGLVVWLYRIAARAPVSTGSLIFFGVGVFWVYFLALFSIRRLSEWLGPRPWRALRTIGVEYIALAFLVDFARNPFQSGLLNLLGYLPFILLAVAGTALRLAALLQRRRQSRSELQP